MNAICSTWVVLLCASCASRRAAIRDTRDVEATSAVETSNMRVDEELVAELQRVWSTGGSLYQGGGLVSPDSGVDSALGLDERDPRGGSARAGIAGELARLRIGPNGRVRFGPGFVVDDRISYIHDPEAVAWIGFSF